MNNNKKKKEEEEDIEEYIFSDILTTGSVNVNYFHKILLCFGFCHRYLKT